VRLVTFAIFIFGGEKELAFDRRPKLTELYVAGVGGQPDFFRRAIGRTFRIAEAGPRQKPHDSGIEVSADNPWGARVLPDKA